MSANHPSPSLSISPSASSPLAEECYHPTPVPSASGTSSQPRAPASKESRFVPNKTERAWLVRALAANGAAVAKSKTLEQIASRVAEQARSRHVTDQMILDEQTMYGMSWRRSYMEGAKTHQILHIAQVVFKQSKAVAVTDWNSDDGEEGVVPGSSVREGGKKGDAQHNLDQALLHYRIAAEKRVVSSEEDAAKTIARLKEDRKAKADRLQKRKASNEKTKTELAPEKKG